MITAETLRRVFARDRIFTTLLVLLAAAVFARLGIWQLDRLAQRRAFNNHVLSMRDLPALDLNTTDGTDLLTQEYRRAVAEGIYDFANQIAVRNQYHEGQYGYRLLTPLILGTDTAAVLVDRGWIPAEGNESASAWGRYDVAGPLHVEGVLRLGTAGPIFGGQPSPTPNPSAPRIDFWNQIDLEAIAAQAHLNLLAAYIQLDPGESSDELPIPSQPEIELTEGPHMGYAVQWFTFAILLLVGYPLYLNRQRP